MMLLATVESIDQKFEILGIVSGSALQVHSAFKDIMSEVKSLVGQIDDQEMMDQLRKEALNKMKKQAHYLGADAVIGVRYDLYPLPEKSFEVWVYGTAISFLKQDTFRKEARDFEASYVEKCVKIDLKARLKSLHEKNKGL